MRSRKTARIVALALMFAYLPVLVGGGECVALCLSAEGGLKLDYTHTCGKSHAELTHRASCGDHAALTGWHSHDSHNDITLFSGSARLTIPALAQENGRTAPDVVFSGPAADILAAPVPAFHSRFHLKIPSESYRSAAISTVLVI